MITEMPAHERESIARWAGQPVERLNLDQVDYYHEQYCKQGFVERRNGQGETKSKRPWWLQMLVDGWAQEAARDAARARSLATGSVRRGEPEPKQDEDEEAEEKQGRVLDGADFVSYYWPK